MRPSLTLLLYALLVMAALVALWAQRAPADVPPLVARSSPWVFLIFALGFALYRFALVAAKRYSAFKAFFQVAVIAVFFLVLLPGSPVSAVGPVNAVPVPASRQSLAGLLSDPDPRVRALAAELARYRPGGVEVAHALVLALNDADPEVRQVAHETLVQLNAGTDLGNSPDAWGKRFP
jgi:hypothetical protein